MYPNASYEKMSNKLCFTVGGVYYWKRRREDKTNKVRIPDGYTQC